jgi:peptidoglycan/xylan/chitin deacetylase (PgdA/CDA1 family)
MINKIFKIFIIVVLMLMTAGFSQAKASPQAKVSITFDDGYESTFNNALPVLDKYGLKGTVYIPTGCINGGNTCRNNVNPPASFMTWSQIRQLQNNHGWEIGAHTVSHGAMSEMTSSKVESELRNSKQEFESRGINVKQFASPFGDYTYSNLAQVAKYYQSHRGFWDVNRNEFPYNDSILRVKQMHGGVSVEETKAAIDEAIVNKDWLILVFHRVRGNSSLNPGDYEYRTAKLDQIAEYIKAKQNEGMIRSVKVSQGLVVPERNILPNQTFVNGISSGWTTDNPNAVFRDTSTKGVFPEAVNSVRFNGSGAGHLFSPKIPVTSGSTYAFKAFINTLGRTGGEFGFFIDEYDENGNWISGKYHPVDNRVVSYFFTNYTPSSSDVRSVRLQTFFSNNPSGNVYVDNYQFYNLTYSQGAVSGLDDGVALRSTMINQIATEEASPIPSLTPLPSAVMVPDFQSEDSSDTATVNFEMENSTEE